MRKLATNYDANCPEVASEVVEWGRRRWNIESSFDVEKNNGYGLEHVFCNHWRCSRNFYLLMQLANNLWQMFNACVVPKLAEGCRKMAQFEWVELLFRAFLEIGITAFEPSRHENTVPNEAPVAARPQRTLDLESLLEDDNTIAAAGNLV